MAVRHLLLSRVAEDVKAFGIGLHQPVLDAVVHHLDEVAGAGGAAIDVALFGGAAELLTAGSSGNVADAGRERFENGIKMIERFARSANHHAIAALQSPDAA